MQALSASSRCTIRAHSPAGTRPPCRSRPSWFFQGPDDRLYPLAQPVREGAWGLLVLAGRADQCQVQAGAGEELLGALAGQALVGDDGGTRSWAVGGLVAEHRAGLLAFAHQLGLARPNPVTVPSQVQMSISLDPQYQREWLGQKP